MKADSSDRRQSVVHRVFGLMFATTVLTSGLLLLGGLAPTTEAMHNTDEWNSDSPGTLHYEGDIGVGSASPRPFRLLVKQNANNFVGGIAVEARGHLNPSTKGALWGVLDHGEMYFGTTTDTAGGLGAATKHMSITPGGRVGIGTAAPKEKLDVSGGIAIGGQTVINTAGQWVGDPTGLQGPEGPPGPQGPPGPHTKSIAVCESDASLKECASVCTGRVIVESVGKESCRVTADLNSCQGVDSNPERPSEYAICCVCDQNPL